MPKNKGRSGQIEKQTMMQSQLQEQKAKVLQARFQKTHIHFNFAKDLFNKLPIDVKEEDIKAYIQNIKIAMNEIEHLFDEEIFGESEAMRMRAEKSGLDIPMGLGAKKL